MLMRQHIADYEISIHAPPRGATTRTIRAILQSQDFNSRPSARGDTIYAAEGIYTHDISIHAPPRGATVSPDSEGKLYIFQFTPLREGRQAFAALRALGLGISIHAPPRGATFRLSSVLVASRISIHAPPRGATTHKPDRATGTSRFQFTPLREGRLAGNRKVLN